MQQTQNPVSTDNITLPRWQFDQIVSSLLQIAQKKATPPKPKPKPPKFVPYEKLVSSKTPTKKKENNYTSVYHSMTGIT
jgi:hypothetical protein